MDQIDLTAAQQDRLESLQAMLSSDAGTYATVTPQDTIDYLLDVAAEIDDPRPQSAELPPTHHTAATQHSFPEQAIREQLEARRLNHSDPEAAAAMDLYTIAVEFDIDGRSSMQKAELIDAIIETAKQQYTDPFAGLDIEAPFAQSADAKAASDSTATQLPESDIAESTADNGMSHDTKDESSAPEAGGSQLDAMLNLLSTHEDKWRSTDGDGRYAVELPDGSTKSVRTKDDVRATLFKNY